MARTFEWRKQWLCVEDPEESSAVMRLAQRRVGQRGEGGIDKENGINDNASVSTAGSSVAYSTSSKRSYRRPNSARLLDIDDDNMSSISSVGFDRVTLPDSGASGSVVIGAAASTAHEATVASTLFKRNVESLFEEILHWVADITGLNNLRAGASEANANAPDSSMVASTFDGVVAGSTEDVNAKMYALLDDGRALVMLLDKSGLIPQSRNQELAKCRAGNSKATSLDKECDETEAAANMNFALFDAVCREQGLPVHFIAVKGDRNSKRIVASFVLLSRCARANNTRAVRQLVINPRLLNSIGLRPDEMTVARLQPILQEMQLRGAFWVPDNFSPNCLLCETPFGFWNKQHHCRACGTLCCATCSSSRAVCLGYKSPQRVCNSCYQQRQSTGQI